ncbi:hypothetical protein [Streptomyces antibioticus]|uniref:hypothetical protein n=1 Tax=Streptomyces antibioticus TaxID=1890 RepID=UPI0033AA8F03
MSGDFVIAVVGCREEVRLYGRQFRDQGVERVGVHEAGSGVGDEHDREGFVAGYREAGVGVAATVQDWCLGSGVREAARAGRHQQVGLGAGLLAVVVVDIDLQCLFAVAEEVESLGGARGEQV